MTIRLLRLAAAAAALAAGSVLAQLSPVPGEPALAPKATVVPQLRIQAKATAPGRGLRTQAELAPIGAEEIEQVRRANRRGDNAKRVVIGVNRSTDDGAPLPSAADLAWVDVAGGRAAQLAVASPGAAALRLAITLAGVPEDVEMVFLGSGAPDRLVGPIRVGDIADRTVAWWSPVTEGDAQTVEFFVPGERDARALPIRVTEASHLFAGPSTRFNKRVADIGSAGSCNVDVPCSALNSDPAFQNAAAAVAQMVFTDSGFTALCTGTLLNDTDTSTQVPWFYSANHCFENENPPYKTSAQMQVVANTLNTLWSFEANACRSLTPSTRYQQLAGGATFVYNNPQADVLFVRLNGTPPAGAFFAGWDPNAIAAGTQVVTVHHPQGDLKKVSQGSVLGFFSPGVAGGAASYIQIRWTSGTTEPGSSGAGVFTASNGQYYLRGGLWGGSALCTNPTGTDNYSRFDQVYPALAPYLSATAGPSTDYTDLWWNANESGWGLNLIQHASRNIFGVWYTYGLDGKRTWFVLPGGSWTSANVFSGDIYATTGPAASAPSFDASRVTRGVVGRGTLTFSDANNGTFAYSINGVSGARTITRQPF
jgi:lysyl endopeptidase